MNRESDVFLMPDMIERLVEGSFIGSRAYTSSINLGAAYYWPMGESEAPYLSVIRPNDIIRTDSGSPISQVTREPSLLTGEVGLTHSTRFGTHVDSFNHSTEDIAFSNEDVTIALSIAVPASQLGEDFTDRTILTLGSSGKLVIRNGNIGYHQATGDYHPTDLLVDTPHHIFLTRDGTTGQLVLYLDNVKHTVVSHQHFLNIDEFAICSDYGNTGKLIAKVQGIAVWKRILTESELSDHFNARTGQVPVVYSENDSELSDLTDVGAYSISDAGKSLTVNSAGGGTEYVEHIRKDALIKDGLHGYSAGAVPSSAICMMQIMNTQLSIPLINTHSKAYALTAPANAIIFTIVKRALGAYETDIPIGTISFAANSNTGVIALTAATTFVVGDILAVKSPDLVEGTRDLFINIIGESPMPFYN